MELKDKLYELSERIKNLKDKIKGEEATKQSLILPFFQILGYDVFNPLEFVPEFTADVGIKKHEKVDYAIMINEQPLVIIETKSCTENLDKHSSQLFRYFGTTVSKFAILTNGIIYKFYTDLEKPNVMDLEPFFTLDMEDLSEQSINYLNNFSKSNLDVNTILNTASDLKYTNLVKMIFKDMIEQPSDDFIRLVLNSSVYEGVKSQKVVDKFKPIVKRAINQYINEIMSNKFMETLNTSKKEAEIKEEPIEEQSKIVTTFEELSAFAIVKSILRKEIDYKRIVYRDTESYFGVLLDDNNRKWICRINLDSKNKHIIISDSNKNGIRYELESLDDIYNYETELLNSAKKYL